MDGNGRATFMEFTTLEDLTGYLRQFVKQKGCEKQVPASEEDLLLTERAFEVLGISYQSGQDSVLTRLLKGTSQRNSARYGNYLRFEESSLKIQNFKTLLPKGDKFFFFYY